MRRTNSGRTVRTVSPFPPGHPGRSSTEEHRATPPPLPSSPPILTRGANTPGLASTSPYTSFNTSSPVDHRPRTPPRQISDALSSSTQSTPTAFSEVSTSSTASPGSIPILPPSDEGHGTHAFGSFSSTGDRGFSTSSFPASVSGGEMLGRSTGEWASEHTERASGEDEDGSGGAGYEARAEEGEGDASESSTFLSDAFSSSPDFSSAFPSPQLPSPIDMNSLLRLSSPTLHRLSGPQQLPLSPTKLKSSRAQRLLSPRVHVSRGDPYRGDQLLPLSRRSRVC